MKKILTKNLILKILAVISAAFLWLIVLNLDDPVSTKTYSNIQVEVTNATAVTNDGQTYRITDGTDNVSVTVKAKKSVLQKIKAEDINVKADMKQLTLKTMVPLEVVIDDYEGSYDKDGTYTTPLNMMVRIEDEANKKFPITPVETGTVRDGYVVGNMSVNPEQVNVKGPESVVNEIAKVTAEVNVTGLSDDATLESELVFYDENDNPISTTLLSNNLGENGVTVDVTINKIVEVPLYFETSDISTEIGYYLGDVTFEPESIKITGEDDVLSEIEEIYIPSEVLEQEGLKEKTVKTVDITPYLPEDVKLVDENGGTVVVTINVKQGGVKTIDVSVGNISIRNPLDGFTVSYLDVEEVSLRVRGTEEMLEKLTLSSEDVYIDLSGCTGAGKYNVKVGVKLPVGYSLVDEVDVNIELKEE
ncbi:MAG: CdaR family protein [Lachnospiraceae bacterium]